MFLIPLFIVGIFVVCGVAAMTVWALWLASRLGGWWRGAVVLPLLGLTIQVAGSVLAMPGFFSGFFGDSPSAEARAVSIASGISEALNLTCFACGTGGAAYGAGIVILVLGTARARQARPSEREP